MTMKLLCLLPFVLLACDTAAPDGGQVKDSSVKDTVTPDIEEVVAPGYTLCDRDSELPNQGCADGQICETTAHVCVDCLLARERCGDSGMEVCEKPVVRGLHDISGGLFEHQSCGFRKVCVPAPNDELHATCEDEKCDPDPDTWTCSESGTVEKCNAWGNELVYEECGSGRACYEGACKPIRHNVLLIFDTSSSMNDYIDHSRPGNPQQCELNGTPCWEQFPICDGAAPMTLFTQAKSIFANVIANEVEWTHFALQRFPQVEEAGNTPYTDIGTGCITGWYAAARPEIGASDKMTGDDDGHAAGAWFDENLGQVVVVPFSRRINVSNKSKILDWLDFNETIGASDEPCDESADCRGGEGKCGQVNGQGRCFYHVENELRALNETPLGKSLFYAGEYFRKYVRIDGKSCVNAVECGSIGYECVDGKCVDPYRDCKEDHIILFTDGDENAYTSTTEFFNPEIQAKRLKYGLECIGDPDCRGGATCVDGTCTAPGMTPTTLSTIDSGGFGALKTIDGTPISIQTTVITLDNRGADNDKIARAGGGPNLSVISTQPEDFRALLRETLDRDPKCKPETRP